MKKQLLLAILALNGCAAHQLTQQECLSTNWSQMGFKDGASGEPMQILTELAQDCQRYRIPIDRNGYVAGWNQGIRHYCTPDYNTGVADGKLGKSAEEITVRQTVCAQAGITLSLKNYEHGRQAGLRSFCTYSNGISKARQGQALPTVCTGHLQTAIASGWNQGAAQFCAQTENAFALGKANKSYPETCPEQEFPAFKSEYDRGIAIGPKISELQAKITDIDARIAEKVKIYHFVKTDKGYIDSYELNPSHFYDSDEATEHLNRVKNLLKIKHDLEAELIPLQTMK